MTAPYRFEVLDGVSHWISGEGPERLAALIVGWLGERYGRRGARVALAARKFGLNNCSAGTSALGH